ncbi:DNA-directed RNA polymerase subunit beta [Striga asiatica]|uniref:DNA-directed RNA polymerase subunit beta n=1 Tax=Striga asiatica TaxID=4170 RepID=A0A5A7R8X7_STRAF|nr:DNA-directed RNA polymerase subunit beta [Striga asiatica]
MECHGWVTTFLGAPDEHISYSPMVLMAEEMNTFYIDASTWIYHRMFNTFTVIHGQCVDPQRSHILLTWILLKKMNISRHQKRRAHVPSEKPHPVASERATGSSIGDDEA